MTVKDIIKATAVFLGRERVLNYLETGENSDTDVYSCVNTLTRCANIVINELVCTYIPMKKKETVFTENGRVYFAALSETILKVEKVTFDGEEIYYKICDEYIDTLFPSVTIEYSYIPSNYGIDENTGYSERDIPSRVIAYGVAAEYCLTERAFDESVMWHKRYSDSLSEIVRPKNAKIKDRSFL
ncbi:MAG: hypothetical protein J6Y43_07210 [Clostridia bacterium]|nr:hypothetical protein [Clostridia bacterium]